MAADMARAAEPVAYLDWDDANGKMTNATLSVSDYEPVTSETREFADGKWYVVANTVVINNGDNIKVNGSAHLILCDNASLTVKNVGDHKAAIDVSVSGSTTNALAIYGQESGSGMLTAKGGECGAGIGGGDSGTGGSVTINGGTVTANGGWDGAGIGGGYGGAGGMVTINGGTVTANGGWDGAGIGGGSHGAGGTVTINGGNVKASSVQGQPKNGSGKDVYCVAVEVAGLQVAGLQVSGLDGYGKKDIYPVDGRVYLYLPDGTHRFTVLDGMTKLDYCAVVKGLDVTVEPMPPKTAMGFFVNGEDVGFDGSGDGWAYDDGSKELLLDGTGPYVLSGSAETGEVQIRIVRDGATVVLSNVVVFAQDRPVLSVESNASLLMAGATSCLATTNSASGTVPAVTVAAGATLTVNLLSAKDRLESMICVFDFDAANAIGGGGKVEVNGGTFFVWSDAPAFASGTGIECGERVVMKTGDDPETAKFADKTDEAPCVLVAPVVTVTVANDIPHVKGFTVSNAVEQIEGEEIADSMIYRVMLEDDVFVGYTVDAGYASQVGNPLAYFAVEDENITIDASTIPTARIIPYRAWNETTQQMEDKVCTSYTVVTADTEIFADGQWYAVTGAVSRGTITVNGSAHLILCDGARLTCDGEKPNVYHCWEPGIVLNDPNTLCVYGQAEGSGTLEALGADDCAGIGSGAGDSPTAGGLTVNGGVVLATGRGYGAGIGGSNTFWWTNYGNGGTVTVNGGRVTASGGPFAAGIGGGSQGRGAAVTIRGGTVASQGGQGGFGHGNGYGVSDNGSLTIDGGSVKAQTAAGLAKNSATKNVYCVTAKVEGLRVEGLNVEGLGNYGTNDIFAIDERIYLWLPDGVHRFSISDGTTTNRYLAVVNGEDVAAERLGPIGFFANGTDVGDAGVRDGWIYFGRVLSLSNANTYVLSGAATNNEVQVNVAASGATAVLSNAVVFASERPAVVLAQGATLTVAANQVLMAGETPETMRYATDCGQNSCVLVGPAVTVTPGTPIGPFTTAEAATNAMAKAMLNPRDDVAEKLGAGSSALETYCNMFGFVVTGRGEAWFVEAVLMPEAWSNVALSAQAATRQIPVADIAALATDGKKDVTVTNCVPGFYYTLYGAAGVTPLAPRFASSASPRGIFALPTTETIYGSVLCGTDEEVRFSGVTKPSAAAGFFTIGVSLIEGQNK